jgi:hypothetical protein
VPPFALPKRRKPALFSTRDFADQIDGRDIVDTDHYDAFAHILCAEERTPPDGR